MKFAHQGGRGSRNKRQSKGGLVEFIAYMSSDKGGRWSKKSMNFADVIYESPPKEGCLGPMQISMMASTKPV